MNGLKENNNKAMAILKSIVSLTESGYDPCEVDVTSLTEAALDFLKKNESILEGGANNEI